MVEGLTKYPDRAPGERNGPFAAIFRFVQPYDAAIEIDLIPGQRENLSLTHARVERYANRPPQQGVAVCVASPQHATRFAPRQSPLTTGVR